MTNPNYIEQEWQYFLSKSRYPQDMRPEVLSELRHLFFMGASSMIVTCSRHNFDDQTGHHLVEEARNYLLSATSRNEVIQ